jgi:tRNA-specific 2-thiouridylase
VVNFERRFEEEVVKPFIDEYLAGRTPIPCTLCNNHIKFDQFLEMADGVGAGKIATGHYARISQDPETHRYRMAKSRDNAKDQTYFLFGLKQEQLARTLFPLGEFTKPQVRDLAREIGLPVAEKNDSQEICFVPNGDYAAFIDAYFRERGLTPDRTHGEIVTSEGLVVGEHSGVHLFTLGQRRGLRVAASEPFYVIATEPVAQRVVVGRGEELLRARMRVKDVNWISIDPIAAPRRAEVKIRNKHVAAPATVFPASGEPASVEVLFDEPQRAITPGQGAVLYDGEFVLGGGWIA